jgi:hypothetical protein
VYKSARTLESDDPDFDRLLSLGEIVDAMPSLNFWHLRIVQDIITLLDDFERHYGCSDCAAVRSGPQLPNELWATIAKPRELLCLDCTERRLGRQLTQGDLKVCVFNAGWIPVSQFTGEDAVLAAQFAEGRKLLPSPDEPPPAPRGANKKATP